MTAFKSVVGLEVHAQLKTETKLFCQCANLFGQPANTLTCPVCLGLPGALPVLNREAVNLAIKAGLALQCAITSTSIFARKNYFYPDLPKGYQISQYDQPLCTKGAVDISLDGKTKRIGIERIHIEEDAGKLLHADTSAESQCSYVDLNRAGVPLIEIVSYPELSNGIEANLYMRKLRSILRYIDVCDGNLEEGSLRCDANISVQPVDSATMGCKVEIKNINSFRFVQKAIEFEIERQIAAINSGLPIVQETRLWDSTRNVTVSMRSKEQSHDYRYFPDPDLRPLQVSNTWVSQVKEDLPELPDAKTDRFEQAWGLPRYDAEVLTAERETALYFETLVQELQQQNSEQIKQASNFMMSEVLRVANEQGVNVDQLKCGAQHIGQLLNLIADNTISKKMAKDVLDHMATSGQSPQHIVQQQGLIQISDSQQLQVIIKSVLQDHPEQLAQYRQGKQKLFGFFVGQVMKRTQGQANPGLVDSILKVELQ